MKKIIFSLSALIILLAGCNPNKEIYKQLDAAQGPFTQNINYTFKDADYTTTSKLALAYAQNAQDSANIKAIDTYKSFGPHREASDYVPLFLEATFLAPDSGSAASITYKYDYSQVFTDNVVITHDTLTQNANFASLYKDTLKILFPNASKNDLALVVYLDTTNGANRYKRGVLFQYGDNDWVWKSDAYYLTPDDYNSMGVPGPGSYDNFSDDYPPSHYLPVFLKNKFPYAFEGDSKDIIYKYYDGSVKYHYAKYFFDGDNWYGYEQKTSLFLKTDKWVFDPTIRFEMSCSDYQIIVDYVKNNDTLSGYMHPQYDNTEYYFGASSYYCNFDMRVYKRRQNDPNGYLTNLSDEEALKVIFDRLQVALKILLEAKYPDATPTVNGVPLYAEVTFATYEPERHKYMMKFQCVDVGKFEYVPDSFKMVQ